MLHRIAPREIEKTVAQMRKLLASGGDGGEADECFRRIASQVLPNFMRWQMTELNRDTATVIVGEAHLRIVGWLLAQIVVHAPPEHRADNLDALFTILAPLVRGFVDGPALRPKVETAAGSA